ncbi:hypothetical protein IEQ34_012269 [Dendrobium chrysotoxum]|uniref:Uncharacterized protein n=1 Tax=Dendrobium chrysotoxum TaxID=161865 RepID=A0AAV7GW47_DENCH|nr:hypothetical protein IEQ34_012269 [Dendrobium chrysotoxum]
MQFLCTHLILLRLSKSILYSIQAPPLPLPPIIFLDGHLDFPAMKTQASALKLRYEAMKGA